ncbi:hypothetical protein AB0B40_03885 [Streptomyces sp. NPDC042638]|uniref:hypothetical protein n=1 Tax=Streptomyces sp. NPDC042638 TaxID=3154333 RepID=UPI0033C48748
MTAGHENARNAGEYDGMDALMAAITDDPLPEEAHRDPAFLTEHRAAQADVAMLRARLTWLAEALTGEKREEQPGDAAAEAPVAGEAVGTGAGDAVAGRAGTLDADVGDAVAETLVAGEAVGTGTGDADVGDAAVGTAAGGTAGGEVAVGPGDGDAVAGGAGAVGAAVGDAGEAAAWGTVAEATAGGDAAVGPGAGDAVAGRAGALDADVGDAAVGTAAGKTVGGNAAVGDAVGGSVAGGAAVGVGGGGTAGVGVAGAARRGRGRVRPVGRAGRSPRTGARRIVIGSLAGVVVVALSLGVGRLVTQGGVDAGAASKSADGEGGRAADPERELACARLAVEGTVARVERQEDPSGSRVTLTVSRTYKPAHGPAEVGVLLDAGTWPAPRTGQHVLVTVARGERYASLWAVGDARVAAERARITGALPGSRDLACPSGDAS